MGFIASLFAAESAPVSAESSWLTRAFGGRTHAGVSISESNALTMPAVYAAIGIIADAIAQLPLVVYRRTSRGREEATDHPAYWILHDQANERMSSFTWRNTVQGHALGWGNGYSQMERNGRGELAGLWPLLPDRTRRAVESDGSVAVQTTIDARSYKIPDSEVVHVPAFSFDGIMGLSPIALAREALGLAKAAEEFGAKWYGQGSKSGGLVSLPPGADDTALERVKKAWREQSGMDEAHRAKVLPEGATYTATSIPPDEAQFLQTREFQIAEIARMYRVPLHMLQSHEKSTAWGSGLEQMFIGFVQTTLQPWIQRWEQELNRKIFLPHERGTYFVKFNLNALLRGDSAARAAFYESAVRTGWMRRSEAREFEDLNQIDGLDNVPMDPSLGVGTTPPGGEGDDE